ncbi:uncharacterized protein LTR77_000184 [Saxophila tyrrhenica]|uniref:CCHC-type domain-containing protein n=1 Tax=Saxophila tyrrhenica TaxID=1690608 RepID=A0AAV9PQG1_9PEZI|nr:hypothetical protein LTR77_000184 [Saxophila tyrrhenica]
MCIRVRVACPLRKPIRRCADKKCDWEVDPAICSEVCAQNAAKAKSAAAASSARQESAPTASLKKSGSTPERPPARPWNIKTLVTFRDPEIPKESLPDYLKAAEQDKCIPIVVQNYYEYLDKITVPTETALKSLQAHLESQGFNLKVNASKGKGAKGKAKENSPATVEEPAERREPESELLCHQSGLDEVPEDWFDEPAELQQSEKQQTLPPDHQKPRVTPSPKVETDKTSVPQKESSPRLRLDNLDLADGKRPPVGPKAKTEMRCASCGNIGHQLSNCWNAHPELRPKKGSHKPKDKRPNKKRKGQEDVRLRRQGEEEEERRRNMYERQAGKHIRNLWIAYWGERLPAPTWSVDPIRCSYCGSDEHKREACSVKAAQNRLTEEKNTRSILVDSWEELVPHSVFDGQPFRDPNIWQEDPHEYVADAEKNGCMRTEAWHYYWHFWVQVRPPPKTKLTCTELSDDVPPFYRAPMPSAESLESWLRYTREKGYPDKAAKDHYIDPLNFPLPGLPSQPGSAPPLSELARATYGAIGKGLGPSPLRFSETASQTLSTENDSGSEASDYDDNWEILPAIVEDGLRRPDLRYSLYSYTRYVEAQGFSRELGRELWITAAVPNIKARIQAILAGLDRTDHDNYARLDVLEDRNPSTT